MAIVIAECCQNHNGDLTVLREMIHSAAEAGADYVKIQSMLADDLARRERFEVGSPESAEGKAITRPYQAEYDRLKPMDLDDEAHHWFVEECAKAGIKPLTTAFSRSRVPFLATLKWDAIKVASYDCGSLPLLRELAQHFPHLYISTGATLDSEIEAAAQLLQGRSFSLLHCVTIYPTPLDEMHLARMAYLRRFTDSVGFSDHSLVERDGLKAAIVALMLGADVVERHYTVLGPKDSRDGPVSINPKQLAELVGFASMPPDELRAYVEANIPEYRIMMGEAQRSLSEGELLNRDYYRGRFASHVNGEAVYNWEDRPLV